MVATTAAPTRARLGSFYVWAAGASTLFAFGSFAGTYWLQLAAGTFVKGSLLLHLHAALFSAWCLLLLSQAWLVADGKLRDHRGWGLAGISLATGMAVIGMATAIVATNRMLAQGYTDLARPFFWLPFSGLATFTGFFIAAIANINRAEWHKRLMICATAMLLPAAAARIGFLAATGGGPGARPGLSRPPPVASGIEGVLIVAPLILAGMIYDWRTRGRPHLAYVIGLAVLLAAGFLGPPVTATHAWGGFVDSVLKIAG
jgi:roadblock/LC7 domain-containing protein